MLISMKSSPKFSSEANGLIEYHACCINYKLSLYIPRIILYYLRDIVYGKLYLHVLYLKIIASYVCIS